MKLFSTIILILLSTLVSSGQDANFLVSDLICLDNDSMAVAEAAILKNDNFDKKNFSITLDMNALPKYGKAEIKKNVPSQLPIFFGNVYYDSITIKYTYTWSSFKKDSLRYIIIDFNNNSAKDSAWVVFDIGCASKSSPNRMTCVKDKIVYTKPNTCSYDFTATEPTYTELPINKASFNMQKDETRTLSIGKYDRISVFSAQFEDGLVDVCETYLEVKDLEKPSISCPQNIFSCDSIVNYKTPITVDNCTSVSLSRSSGLASGSIFPKGKSTVSYLATDFNGNTNSCSFTIEVSDVNNISWINTAIDTICSNAVPINLNDSLNIQSSGLWSNNAPNGIFAPSANSVNSRHTVSFTINQNNCSKTVKKDFYILPALSLNITPFPTQICAAYGSIDLQSFKNETIPGNWFLDNLEVSKQINTTNLSIGDHNLKFKSSDNRCAKEYSQNFKITQVPTTVSFTHEICSKEFEQKINSEVDSVLFISPFLEYKFTDDSLKLISSDFVTKEITFVDYEDFQCLSVSNIKVGFYENPTKSITQDTIFLNFNESNFSLGANEVTIGNGKWLFNKNNISLDNEFSAKTDGIISDSKEEALVWEVSNGPCPVSLDTQWIKKRELVVPNAFSPNEDGKNDFFIFDGVQEYMNVHFEVINRWGQVVYKNTDYKNDWNGTDKKGEILPNDIYYFYAKIDENEPLKGKITLKR